MFDAVILQKKFFRSDTFWTLKPIFRSFLRLVPIFLDTRALMKSQYWSRKRIEELKEERLRRLLLDARRVPFWQNVFNAAPIRETMPAKEVLANLPVTSKKDFTQRPLKEIANMALLPSSDADHTSGSTGRPFNFYFDWHAGLRSFAVTERIFRTAKGGKRFPIVYMRWRPRNGFTPYHTWLFMRGFHGVAHRMEEFRKLGEKFPKGFILYGYTSSVLEVIRQAERLHMKFPLAAVMATGEGIGDSDREYIEQATQAGFFGVYASRETGFLAYECEKHKLHISEEWAFLETVDEEGKPCPPGVEGRILVTTFDNRVMPFIRYEIGDRGIISDEPCSCGRTLRTITLRGRSAEVIEVEGGRKVALLDITTAIDRFWGSIQQFKIIQTGSLSFVIQVVPKPVFKETKERLERLLIQILHPRARIEWREVQSIPEAKSGKAVYFERDFEYK